MKCIQSILSTKTTESGHIIRIKDDEAEVKVRGGDWKYVPKSEYKKFLYPEGTEHHKKEDKKKHHAK